MADCPLYIGDPAIALVDSGWTTFYGFANASWALAREQIETLQSFTIEPVRYAASWSFEAALGEVVRPHKPARPADLALSHDALHEPGAAPTFDAITLELTPAPADTLGAPPALSLPARPVLSLVPDPGDAPVLAPVLVPPAPVLDWPELPSLLALDLPAAPAITLPTFEGVRPVLDVVVPDVPTGFTPAAYVSALLDQVCARVATMLEGGTGLPAAVEQALRDRAFVAVDAQELRAIAQATEEFSARGFTEPNGLLVARLAEVRQNGQNQRNALSRDIYVRAHEVEIENLRFAVTSGIQLEGTLIQLHGQTQTLLLQSNQFLRDTLLAVYNARIALFNAQQQAFATDAQVYRDRIQAEIAKIELVRAQIEAERTKGEINEQRVRLYAERVRAVQTQADIYRAVVEGAKAQADVQTAVMDGYRTKVQAFGERLRAQGLQWDGYRAEIEGERAKVGLYEASANAFATRIRSWSEINQGRIAAGQFRIAANDQALRAFAAQVERLRADLEAERARLAAVAQVYEADVRAYEGEGTIERLVAETSQRRFELYLNRERARLDVALRDAEVRITQVRETAALLLEASKTVAQTASNLAASSFSAVNFSAGVNSSRSESHGCSTTTNLQGFIN